MLRCRKTSELIPLLSKEGWLRLNKKIPFLSGADGVVSNFQQKITSATRASIRRLRDLFTKHPSARLRILRGIYFIAQPPLENGGEWGATTPELIPA